METTAEQKSTLNKIISTIGELPASPAIVSAVMGLTSNLDSKVADVCKVLSRDQTLTAKVLKLSNSSFYGRSKEVSSLQEAILILGFFTVRSMVVATSAHSMYELEESDSPQTKLWRHSLSSAVAARQIAKHLGHPDKEEIFIATLLHDIGKLVLLQKLSQVYEQVVEEVEKTRGSFFEVESKRLGFTHCGVALTLLEQWSFPRSLIQAIHEHHELPSMEDSGIVPISYVINLGNYMAKRLDVGFHDQRVDSLSDLNSARAMSLDEEVLERLSQESQEHYQIEAKILDEK